MGRQEWQLLFWVTLCVYNKLQDVLDVIRHRCVDAGRKENAAEAEYQYVVADLYAGMVVPLATANVNARWSPTPPTKPICSVKRHC